MAYRIMSDSNRAQAPESINDMVLSPNGTGAFNRALASCAKSATACSLMKTISESSKTVWIVVNTYGAMNDQFTNIDTTTGAVFWSEKGDATIEGGGKPGGELKRKGFVELGDYGEFHPELRLFHELGHVVQWIEDSGRFEILKEYKSTVKGSQIPLRLEEDNVKRNEWPICDEMGWAKRVGYQHLKLA